MDPDSQPDLPSGLPPVLSAELTDISSDVARPWGFWPTIAWSVLIAVCHVLAQSIAVGIFIAMGAVPNLDRHNLKEAMSNGELLSFVTLATAPVVVCLCLGAAWRRKGISFKEYFGLRWPPRKIALQWSGAFMVFLVMIDVALPPQTAG